MILPTKHVPLRMSCLAVAAKLLEGLKDSQSVSALWYKVREAPEVATFDRYVQALDLLYSLGLVEYEDGLLKRMA
jgi:hypothetical protein